MPDDPEDEPRSPEEEAEFQALWKAAEAEFEAEATLTYGPPELRARKNQRYVDRLIRRYSEPVIRGLLDALSHSKWPTCAEALAEIDLFSTPLAEIIQPFELGGRHFRVESVAGDDYVVSISAAYGLAGSGGSFVLTRKADTFVITRELSRTGC